MVFDEEEKKGERKISQSCAPPRLPYSLRLSDQAPGDSFSWVNWALSRYKDTTHKDDFSNGSFFILK